MKPIYYIILSTILFASCSIQFPRPLNTNGIRVHDVSLLTDTRGWNIVEQYSDTLTGDGTNYFLDTRNQACMVDNIIYFKPNGSCNTSYGNIRSCSGSTEPATQTGRWQLIENNRILKHNISHTAFFVQRTVYNQIVELSPTTLTMVMRSTFNFMGVSKTVQTKATYKHP